MPNNDAAIEAAIRERQKRRWATNGGGDINGDGEELADIDHLLATCDSLRAERDSLREALEEVLRSGVEFDDPRVNYVIMQVDRDALTQARAALAVQTCANCDACERAANSDSTTAGFFYRKCEKHRAVVQKEGETVSKPTKANLECADVILERNNLDPSTWRDLRRDIALTIDIAEREARAQERKKHKK